MPFRRCGSSLGGYIFSGDCTGKYLSFPYLPAAVVGVATPIKLCAVTAMPNRGGKPRSEHEESAACFGKRFVIKSVVTGQRRSVGCLCENLC